MAFSGKLNTLSTFYMIGKAGWNVFRLLNTPSPQVQVNNNPYRPSEWVERGATDGNEEELIQLIPNIAEKQLVKTGTAKVEEEITIGYFFDAHLREDHNGSVRITDHPVQDGTNISDHAYNLPDKLSLEIFVSDVMDAVVVDQFSEYDTKSISAYEILRALKEQRMPLSVKTRLHFYENMLIEHMNTPDDYKSSKSLKCSIIMKQIITATVATETAKSTKPQVTNTTKSNPSSSTPQEPSLLQRLTTYKQNAVAKYQTSVGAQ